MGKWQHQISSSGMESAPQDGRVPTTTREKLYELRNYLTGLDWLQNEMGGHSSCRSDRAFPFVHMIRYFNLLTLALADDLPTRKHEHCEIAGKYVESYTAGVLAIGSDVLDWLRQTGAFTGDVDTDMERLVENLPRLRELWPFPLFDYDDLFSRVCSEFGTMNGDQVSGDKPPQDDPPPPQSPVKLLTSWREITDALDLQHDDRDKVKSLNERYEGPIPKPRRGSQPIVDKEELITWWNSLAIRQQELADQQLGAELSAEDSYAHGKSGEVVPEIGGGVKKRHRDHKR